MAALADGAGLRQLGRLAAALPDRTQRDAARATYRVAHREDRKLSAAQGRAAAGGPARERVSAARGAISEELTERARIEERTEEILTEIEWPDRKRCPRWSAGSSIASITARRAGAGR